MKNKETLALDFKSATLYAVRVVLHSHDDQALRAALARRMSDAGSFFHGEPVVIDAHGLEQAPDWAALVQDLRQHGLHPMGITAPEALLPGALQAGLVQVELSAAPARPAAPEAPPPELTAIRPTPAPAPAPPAQPAAAAPAAMIVNGPLRSGQRLYARDTDLIVIGVVSQGAEVIADGNIHVYGPLRGKAMAGARGNTAARIFTTRLEPELIAIAGVYRVVETQLEPALYRQPTLIQLEGDSLQIRALDS